MAKRKFRIQHNKKLFWVIIVLLIALIALIWFIVQKGEGEESVVECSADDDCIPATCCHPDSCVSKEQAPDCSIMGCTAVCSGPLDCGAGNCGCVKGKCEVISKE